MGMQAGTSENRFDNQSGADMAIIGAIANAMDAAVDSIRDLDCGRSGRVQSPGRIDALNFGTDHCGGKSQSTGCMLAEESHQDAPPLVVNVLEFPKAEHGRGASTKGGVAQESGVLQKAIADIDDRATNPVIDDVEDPEDQPEDEMKVTMQADVQVFLAQQFSEAGRLVSLKGCQKPFVNTS